ncbi:hypothetical protein EV424DRAFT_1544032 [Suillus variegatus]|nr:hypothetical protein EV424DRAFT_1544032 [Suillus variegatus]
MDLLEDIFASSIADRVRKTVFDRNWQKSPSDSGLTQNNIFQDGSRVSLPFPPLPVAIQNPATARRNISTTATPATPRPAPTNNQPVVYIQNAARHAKLVKLTDAITTAQDTYQEEACAIAKDNGRSLKWTRRQLYTGKGVFNRRRANPWNAFNRLRENINTYRQSRVKVTRANPKALQKDVNATFKTMQTEWASIQARTGLEGMYLAVRGDVEQYHEPKLFYTAKVGSFIKDVLGMEPKRFALKVESWVVGDFDSAGTVSQRLSLTKLVSLCRQHIQDGLDIIIPTLRHPPKKKVKMNYNNYEGKIVETYGVALENFPGTIRNPGNIGRREDLINLHDLLLKGTCSWTKLTSDELVERIAKNKERQANGEPIYKTRKHQEKTPIAKSAEIVEDTEDDGMSSTEA